MHFASPWAWLLLPALAALWWRSLRQGRVRQAAVGYSDLGRLRAIPGAVRPLWENHLPITLTALSLVCLVAALARPQHLVRQGGTSNGIDIMLCLDTSGSMNAQDLQPSRVAAATAVSQEFVRQRPNDRIGLVVFSSVAITQCPLTTDHAALQTALAATRVGMTQTDGTAIGSGIATCINRLKDVPGKSKVIVLLTDGSNNSGAVDPITAAKMAARYGIKVYTIGMGTSGEAPMTVSDPMFGERTVMVEADLDEPALRQIAAITGGQYFRATDTDALHGVYDDINRLEKRVAPKTEVADVHEVYSWFLAPGLLLLGLSMLLEHTLFMEVV